MWEDANRKQPPQPGAAAGGRAKKDRRRRAADLVLWVQILLCLAALGAAVAAKHLQWPVYRPLRTAFYRALEAPGLRPPGPRLPAPARADVTARTGRRSSTWRRARPHRPARRLPAAPARRPRRHRRAPPLQTAAAIPRARTTAEERRA